jgi:hypothetical protein
VFDSELEAQAFEGFAVVGVLAAAFGGGGGDAGGRVGEDDGGVGLVAVLAARAGGLGPADGALLEQRVVVEAGGVNPGVRPGVVPE